MKKILLLTVLSIQNNAMGKYLPNFVIEPVTCYHKMFSSNLYKNVIGYQDNVGDPIGYSVKIRDNGIKYADKEKNIINSFLNLFLFNNVDPFATCDQLENKLRAVPSELNTVQANKIFYNLVSKGCYLKCVNGHFKEENIHKTRGITINNIYFNPNYASFEIESKNYNATFIEKVFKDGEMPMGQVEPGYFQKSYNIIQSGVTLDTATEKNVSAYTLFKKDALLSDAFQKIYEKYYFQYNPDTAGICLKNKETSGLIAKNFLNNDLQNFVLTNDKKVYFVNNQMITGQFAYKKEKDGTYHQLTKKELKKITYDYPTFSNCRNPVYIPLADLKDMIVEGTKI